MAVPTFVDLQGFIVDGRFVVKEVAALRKEQFSHTIFLGVRYRNIFLRNPTNRAFGGWWHNIIDYVGKMETFHTVWLNG